MNLLDYEKRITELEREVANLKLDKIEVQSQLNMLSMLMSWMKRKTVWEAICDDYPWLKEY